MSEEEMANISSSPDDTMPRESDVSTNPECLRLWKPAVQRKPEKLNCNTETSPPHNNPSMSELHDDADHHLSKITELCAHTLFKNEMEGDSASSDSSSWREIGDERRRWDFPKQNGNTIWAPRVANKSHVRPAVEGRHWDSPNHAEGSIWAPRDDDESHVGPAVKGRHWDSTKTAVGSCSRKGTRPARRLSTDAVNLAQIPSSCRPALLGDSLLAQIRLPLLCSTGKSFPINEPQNLP